MAFTESFELLKNVHIMTAMVTPFDADNNIDYAALKTLIDYLLAHHTEALLVGGTTGESPTLSHHEKIELFEATKEIVANRVPLIANVGTNNTAESFDFTKEVAALGGFAAGLAVNPYYNKPNQEGLYQHFKALAEASDLPIILYNIPGRTVVKLNVETVIRLAQLPNIIAVKECTDVASLAAIIEEAPADFLVYTGEDGLAFHNVALGGQGVISVASHVLGDELYEMLSALTEGNMPQAAAIQRAILPKMNSLFSLPNPAPVKAVLNSQDISVGFPRLPLLAATEAELEAILEIMNKK